MNDIGRKLITGIFIIWLSLSVAQLLASNRMATQGDRLRTYQVNTRRIEEDNQELRNDLAELNALDRVASESAKLGFQEIDRFIYLSPPPPLALDGDI